MTEKRPLQKEAWAMENDALGAERWIPTSQKQ